MIRFYAPDIELTGTLPESDSNHCIRVLRHKPGDIIAVIDGKGNEYRCRVFDTNSKKTAVEIVEKHREPLSWNYNIIIAVAPTKLMDRMEWLVEKLTEIGVNQIVPILCEHSERKEIKIERLEKIAVSAMKQSLKATMPIISPMTPISKFISDFANYNGQHFVAYCDDQVERHLLSTEIKTSKNEIILIGPEGDFSPSEIKKLIDNGFLPVSLGDCRLRTETAAVVACNTVHIINQINS